MHHRKQDQSPKTSDNNVESEETRFEESLWMEVEGSVYHANFLEFTLAGLFGLLQEDFQDHFNGRLRESQDEGDILEFDFEGNILKKKNYPGFVYARRYRRLDPRPFLSSLETTTDTYGFVWQWIDPKTPTNLSFNYTQVNLSPLDDSEEDSLQRNSNLRFDTSYKFTDSNILSFVYNGRSTQEEPNGLNYDTDELTLSHRLDFGDRTRYLLESEVSYFDQRGTFDIGRARWREFLRIDHAPNARSWYQLEFLDRTQGNLSNVDPIKERSWFLSATIEHQWYDSLLSQMHMFWNRQNFGSGLQINRFGFQPSFNYRKKNRWGELVADYRFRAQRENREGLGRRAGVVDERHVFQDPQPIVPANTNISVSSIVITPEDASTIYRTGRDYQVRTVGNQVEIERVPTGRIPDGQSVLIDYSFLIGGDYRLDTFTQNLNIRQDFKFGLSPYYRLHRQDQTIFPEDATGAIAEDITAHAIGAEFERSPFHLTAEYEDYDSTISPYKAVRVGADFTQRFDFWGTLRLRARWSDIERSGDQERHLRFLTVEARHRQTIGEHLTLEGAVVFRNEEDSLSGHDEGVDVDLSIEWIIRDTELRITYEYGDYEDDFAENRNSYLFVQMRRWF